MANKHSSKRMKWLSMDLHLHTPASKDYQQPETTYLEFLQQAELRGLDIIAFTDHNTVAGYRRMMEDVHQLEMLESLGRLLPEESQQLQEYRRLLKKILVLPGFEFTATFGFHIIGIFSPQKSAREIEHILLSLNIPGDQVDDGSVTVGASSDVLTVYRAINQAGGLVIAAHANSTNGVAMRGFSFGGQTKIAYTQDPNLHALEVTDLEQKGRRTTATFFSGTKPEYPRRMHCIQGSDAHRLTPDTKRNKVLGVGDRVTEVLLPEASFEALFDLFTSNDFARTRPRRHKAEPVYDFIRTAREEGPNIVQDFHENMTVRGGKLYAIIADICAFANTNGGTLYIGLQADPKKPVVGVTRTKQAIAQLESEISKRISPPLQSTVDEHPANGKKILRVLVPRGDDPPYAVDESKIYVRSETETGLAVRDEIVGLVMRGKTLPVPELQTPVPNQEPATEENVPNLAPRTGVEIVSVEERKGTRYYTVRDLRNGSVVKNVTISSARRLWHYALSQYAKYPDPITKADIQWQGDLGLLRNYRQGKQTRYDLVQRTTEGNRFYFGVTDDGIHGPWKTLVGEDEA